MTMINSVEQYLSELKKELAGSDRATVQDALSDAEEYLRTALSNTMNTGSGISEAEALGQIIDRYGQPKEVATAYQEVGPRIRPAPPKTVYQETEAPVETPAAADNRPFFARFFGVFTEPRAWGSLLYLIFALATGIIYFTWAVTGLSLSVGLMVLIIGIPVAGAFLLSVRGIALIEGRIIEALLGVRMPRRPLFSRRDIGWWQKIKGMLTSLHTWTAIAYMVLQLPLGIIYFCVVIVLIAVSLWCIALPVLQLAFNIPVVTNYSTYYYLAWYMMPLTVIAGVFLLTATMHLAKVIGRNHGKLAKFMLVRE